MSGYALTPSLAAKYAPGHEFSHLPVTWISRSVHRTCSHPLTSEKTLFHSMQLHWIDLSIIVLYLIATIFVGFWVSKRASKDMKSYFLDRKSTRLNSSHL